MLINPNGSDFSADAWGGGTAQDVPGSHRARCGEPASDIDTAEVDSLKVLDPEWPIREADISLCANRYRIGARCLSLNSCGRMDRNRG